MHWLFSIVFSLSTAFPFLTSIWMTFEWLNSTINCWKEIQSFYIPRVLAGLRISAYCLDNRIIWLRIEFDNTAFSRNFRDIALWYLHTECLSLRLLHQWLYWLDLIAWYFFPQEELKSALVLEVFHIWKYLPLALILNTSVTAACILLGVLLHNLQRGSSVSWRWVWLGPCPRMAYFAHIFPCEGFVFLLGCLKNYLGSNSNSLRWGLRVDFSILIFLGRQCGLSLCRCNPSFVSGIFSSYILFFPLLSLWLSWSFPLLK